MPHPLSRAAVVKAVASVTAAVVIVGAAVTWASAETDVVVTRVVDGDTIDVTVDGDERRIRLLNVDTPETVDPDEPVECMGAEATAFLEDLLPVGTPVTLEYDQEREDRYGRDLAGVFLDDVLVNAEIARAGLGVAVLVEPNDRFLAEVSRAQQEAEAEQVGLFDPAIDCTVPSQTAAYDALVEETLDGAADGTDLESLEEYGADLAAALAVGVALGELLDGDTSVFPLLAFGADIADIKRGTSRVTERLETRIESNDKDVSEEQDRLEAERLAAEEAQRQAAREAEEREAREEAERQAAERDAARRTTSDNAGGSGSAPSSDDPPPPPPPPPTEPEPAPGGGLPSDAGYTGCRDYSLQYPPSAADRQGRPFTKIDCTTKLPIG